MFEQEIRNLHSLLAHCAAARRSLDSWIFRGQSQDLSPRLATSLERACRLADGTLEHAREREGWAIREFQRRIHHYMKDVPGGGCMLEWLALMQHHGAPTRLLDWTYSPAVAAFFACDHALRTGTGAEIWMLNATWATAASAERFPPGFAPAYISEQLPSHESEELFANVFMTAESPMCFCPANAFRLNERQTIQKGVFTVVGDPTKPTVENLEALGGYYGDADNARVLLLPRADIPAMLADLLDMNMTNASLFPGLDGFARSLLGLPRRSAD